MKEKLIDFLGSVKKYNATVLDTISRDGVEVNKVQVLLKEIPELIRSIFAEFPKGIYAECEEFFKSFHNFLLRCEDAEFVVDNINMLGSSVELFDECIMLMLENCNHRFKICSCCGKEVAYLPLPSYYDEMEKAMGVPEGIISETLNKTEYICPICCSSDRDRLIVSFMKQLELDKVIADESFLQIAPASSIEHWIHGNCPAITYHSTDLYMENVTFKSDIQNMNQIADGCYDYWICSHVLEHVRDDRKAMSELHRILKDDGIGIFLVPIVMGADTIEEEWGLSEAENWRRFGQGDHCRRYGRKALIERLEEAGFRVHALGKDYFGEELFNECGLIDTSTLYILTKNECNINELIRSKIEKRKKQVKAEPLVSVILPCYNHEKYIEEAIESVLNQTYKNIEFLVADDGSTDATPQILSKYKDRMDELHLFETNTMGEIGKFLLERAHGKYIAMMHSDDVWQPEKLSMQVAYLENHPECGACFTGCQYIGEDMSQIAAPFHEMNMKKEQWLRYFFSNSNCLVHPSIMIHKDLYIELWTKEVARRFWQIPDYWMWLNLVLKKDIHIIEKKLTLFRVHKSNSSSVTNETLVRHLAEEAYMWYDIFRKISNEYFLEAFKDLLINPNVSDENEIECEKILVLLKHARVGYLKQAGIFYAFEICKSPEIITLLEEKYNWNRLDMKNITGSFLQS